MDSLKNAANYVSETVQGAAAGVQKEGNKQIAKDSNVPVGDRASAAADYVSSAVKETGHDANAKAHKEAI